MRHLVLIAFLSATSQAFADVPEPVVTHASSYQGHATIAGRLSSNPDAVTGITVENGGLKYSTITDAEGNWSVVIRHRSVSYSVKSFDLKGSGDASHEVKLQLK